nr:hypothetical protein [Caldimonas sp.]
MQPRRRARRIGECRGAQAQRLGDLVADPVGAAEPCVEQLDPARTDDDENDVRFLDGGVDHGDEVVPGLDVVDVAEDVRDVGPLAQRPLQERDRRRVIVAAITDEDVLRAAGPGRVGRC